MDDFNEMIQDFDKQLKQTQSTIQNDTTTQQTDTQYKKLQNTHQLLKQQLNELKGVQRTQAQDKLKSRDEKIKAIEQTIQRCKGNSVSAPAQFSNDAATATYQKQLMANAYIGDANRSAQEAAQTGQVIIESLDSQNKKMKTISATTQHIQQNTAKSDELIKTMQRKEKCVNIILYTIVAFFIGLDCLAFWVFHHDTK